MRVNSLSRIIEEKLLTYNIPYKVYGGFKFFERKEIKDTTAYLHLIANPNDNDSAIRMLSFPKKGIGDVSIAQINELAKTNSVSIMDIVNNASEYGISGSLKTKLDGVRDLFINLNSKKDIMPIEEFVSYVINQVGIKDAIGTKTEDDENKCLNVDDFLKSVTEYSDANEGATLDDFLQSITLMRDIDNMSEEDNFVSLLTVHSAKGLEFDTVFIAGLNDGLFPLSRAINSNDQNDLEEERRLMYVAVTRAKNRLFLTRSKVKFSFESKRTEYTMISRFLTEMFEELKINKTPYSSNIIKTNLSESGFDDYLESSNRKESLDQRMSSHINIVNVSKSNESNSNTASSAPKINIQEYSKFRTGVKVKHNHFGVGTITLGVKDFASAFVTINFESVGIKTLSLKYANLEIIN